MSNRHARPAHHEGPEIRIKSQLDHEKVDLWIRTVFRMLTGRRVKDKDSDHNPNATRETIESVVVAVILAFLFRGYIAEAFVIPTGSMAPTLRGRHMDIVCPQCQFQYNTGASRENVEDGRSRGEVTATTCPICHFTLELNKQDYPNERSFNGDRILVSKFAYQLYEPERWDVIVFKFPGNAKQNYIKRLVGMPGETIRIRHGDIHTVSDDGVVRLVRKPPSKVRAMMQLVDDTDHIATQLREVGWPSRWQQASAVAEDSEWQISQEGDRFQVDGGDRETWLRYRHLIPYPEDWREISRGQLPERMESEDGELITDYYPYNDTRSVWEAIGNAWVGDLAFECQLEVNSETGEVVLDLVEGGAHHECRIDVATGAATLSMREFDGTPRAFGETDSGPLTVTGQTAVRGSGSYHIRFANCDDRLYLWVNKRFVDFDGATTFLTPGDVVPRSNEQDPGDLAPVGIATRNASLTVRQLRVLRDVYYLAQESDQRFNSSEYDIALGPYEFQEVLTNPDLWSSTQLFSSRRSVDFVMGEGQYFPLGDNSPQSRDARLWSEGSRRTGYRDPPPYVERELLIGKALIVYWPHGWRPRSPWLARLTLNLAFIPNFSQMGLIR